MAPPSSSKKKGLKQGSLFSFFSKSPAPKKASASASAAAPANAKAKGKGVSGKPESSKKQNPTTTNNNNSNDNGKERKATPTRQAPAPPSRAGSSAPTPTPTPSSFGRVSGNTLWRKLREGSRVGIYWKDDRCYYPCTVEKRAPSDKDGKASSRFFVRYDDGESEWTDMATEKLRWCEDDDEFEREEENENENEEDVPEASGGAGSGRRSNRNNHSSSNKRRRSIQESDDDEEEEEWQDPGEDESDDDDGSVFEAAVDEEEDNEDELAEEDNWMVTDDENEDEDEDRPSAKKNKRKRKTTKSKAGGTLTVTRHNDNSSTPPPSKRPKPGTGSSGSGGPSATTTTTGSNGNAFKTPLKQFSHTVSPQTASSQKSKTKTARPATTPSPSHPHKNLQLSSPSPSPPTSHRTGNKRLNPHLPSEALPCNTEKGALNVRGAHVHNHLGFLRVPRDAMGRYRDHPDYDCRTLRVDEAEWKKVTGSDMTAAVKQWWKLKSQYFDTVLLFKTGKFYEMFHTDADVGVEVLGFIYMKGKSAHSGFPEISYGQFADKLVRAGYKVARVEQTETPDMLKSRKARTPRSQKKPQVVNREVCSVMSLGTRTFCALDDKSALLASEANGTAHESCGPLLAIRETLLGSGAEGGETSGEGDNDDDDNNDDDGGVRPVCEYGITVVDAVRGTLTLGMFADDVLRNRMRTLLACFEPSEILYQPSGKASGELVSLLKAHRAGTRKPCRLEVVRTEESFPKSTALDENHARDLERGTGPHRTVRPWDPEETLEELHRRAYYPRASRSKTTPHGGKPSVARWPAVLRMVVEGRAELCLSSLGAALFYLQRNLIDREILSMGIVRAYIPQESKTIARSDNKSGSEAHAGTDGFWSTQQQQQQQQPVAVSQDESVLDGFEENPLFKIPSATRAHTPDSGASEEAKAIARAEEQITHMSLDGTTLHNLEILTNAVDFKTTGSLWSKVNSTKSPHGARMLRAWLLRPLFQKADIERRADAVQELAGGAGALALREARASVLGKIGDLDRLLSRVHSMSVGVSAGEAGASGPGGAIEGAGEGCASHEYHPNERAVLYEGPAYTKRKVTDFKNLLKGLQKACQIPEIFADLDLDPGCLLYKLVRQGCDGGLFPDMVESLDWFFENFDCDKAASGQFVPGRGTDPIYDEACDTIDRIEADLESYKQEMIREELTPRHVAGRAWKYINTKPDSKDKYLIELPVTVKVPHDFHVKAKRGSGQKQVNKYRTPLVAGLVSELERALEIQQTRRAKGMQIIFARFDSQRSLWAAAAHATAILDALGSLAVLAGSQGYSRPEILSCDAGTQPSLSIVQGRHPVVENTFHSSEFIPNDLELGPGETEAGKPARLLLLSGPNMGGKSTMLRQTCLISILAQIGSYVPAESCQLTPIDCIFTRLGASDRILLGQSTFFVELAETAAALRGATRRSLVIMDELGRGTSTFDGTAIASATVKHLVERSQCLSLFATHYHSLLDEWKNAPNVRLGHMQCIVDDETDAGSSIGNSNITFLYTLGPGACPRSFGINVAKLAGLPNEVLANAKRVSAEFEEEMACGGSGAEANSNEDDAKEKMQNILKLIADENYSDLLTLWQSVQAKSD